VGKGSRRKILVAKSKSTDERETPDNLFKPLDSIFHFTLDAAAHRDRHKVDRYFTIEDDGLRQSWAGETVFCNPPYSRGQLSLWIDKFWAVHDQAIVVAILPGDTSTRWMQKVWRTAAYVHFPRGRFKFEDYGSAAKTATITAVWARSESIAYWSWCRDITRHFGGRGFCLG
jgi:phage N-6-adenine-methyltransferase